MKKKWYRICAGMIIQSVVCLRSREHISTDSDRHRNRSFRKRPGSTRLRHGPDSRG